MDSLLERKLNRFGLLSLALVFISTLASIMVFDTVLQMNRVTTATLLGEAIQKSVRNHSFRETAYLAGSSQVVFDRVKIIDKTNRPLFEWNKTSSGRVPWSSKNISIRLNEFEYLIVTYDRQPFWWGYFFLVVSTLAFGLMIARFFRSHLVRAHQITIESQTSQIRANLARQISHDIRSPLGILRRGIATATGISTHERSELERQVSKIRHIADTLLDETRNLAQLPNDEALIDDSQLIALDLHAVLLECVNAKNREVGHHAITFESIPETGSYYGKISAIEFERMISNLLNNALEASTNSEIPPRISLIQKDSQIQISLSDSGPGMPESLIEILGSKPISHGKPKGNGLGLFHAFQTIRTWGGEIEIESHNGKDHSNQGTTIRLILPAVASPTHLIRPIQLKTLLSAADCVVLVGHPTEKQNCRLSIPHMNLVSLEHSQLQDWFAKNFINLDQPQFLFFADSEQDVSLMIDLISRLDLSRQSVMISHDWKELVSSKRTLPLALVILPKIYL